METGDILAQVYKKYITEDALPDGRMYYNISQRILQPTLEGNHELITDVAKQVQENINKQAGLGLKAVVPEFNQERVDGLVNHLDHAETFEDIARTLDEPIKQHAMSIVSDAIEANAKFQYDVGLQPMIVREAEHKCCEWCSRLEGSFKYPDEVPADVYRRHDRCRCTVDYVVGKKRQDVHHGNRGQKRRYVKDEYDTYVFSKNARIKRAKEMETTEAERKKAAREKRIATWNDKRKMLSKDVEDVTSEYLKKSSPGSGKVLVDEGVKQEDIKIATWIRDTLGGDIRVLKESGMYGVKMPDGYWKDSYIEFKNASSKTSIDDRLRKAGTQIAETLEREGRTGDIGRILVDITKRKIDQDAAVSEIVRRLPIRAKGDIDVLIIENGTLIKIVRYKQE